MPSRSLNKSRDVYLDRMHRVTEYIDKHLDQYLDLESLAQVAHFSPFHFHRLFAAWMGETLGSYLRRRRCEIAATRLIAQPGLPVLEVALAVGFGSAEAFNHAFSARFGCSPTTWRLRHAALGAAKSNSDQVMSNPDQATLEKTMNDGALGHPKAEAVMKVEVIDRKPATIAYMRRVGPYGEGLSQFWQTEVYPWMLAGGLLGRPRYGISHDDPSVAAPEQCRYDAGCEIPANFNVLGKAHKTVVPGGKYAELSFKGTAGEIDAAWMSLLRDWLPSSGMQLDGRPMFEYYSEGSHYDPETGVFDCKLCVPVIPL